MRKHTAADDNIFYRDVAKSYPVVDHAEGIYLYDKKGSRYIDAAGGACVVSIGHGVSEILEAISEQARRVCFAHVTQFTSEPQIELARRLIDMAPPGFGKAFFVSGGSEATETALKMARLYHVEKGNQSKHKVIGRWHSYHGGSIGGLSMSGTVPRRKLYEPYLLNFPHILPCYCYRCPYGKEYPSCGVQCATELERVIALEGPDTIAAFIAEPIVAGPLGGATPPPEYFRTIREICTKYDILMIDDEVICGVGRTGRNFGIEHWEVVPDIIVTAKNLSGGYAPLGAVLISESIFEVFARRSTVFTHGFTYGGAPLSCAAGVAVLRYIEEHKLVARCAEMGDYLFERARSLQTIPMVGDIRGKGLLMGIELVADRGSKRPFERSLKVGERAVRNAFERGLIVLGGLGNIDGVLLTPPYTISRSEIDETISILSETLRELSIATAAETR